MGCFLREDLKLSDVGIIKRVCFFVVFEASVPPKSLSYSPRHEESWEVRAKLLALVST